ncbi:NHL domain-containing protein [Simplicispira lacusdiani]|uniref:NHL domain-containing protein n=1 Tax=Simplicispira lacusdiani TaxID=2213010 RepID=UPI00130072B5|nr:hypothetical protein [Simplicispira lacusdiani]
MPDIAPNDRLQRISLLAALVIPILTACGGGSSGSAETPTTPPNPSAPATPLSLLAGNTDGAGNQDGAALTAARFSLSLGGMAVTSSGEVVIADGHRIRKLSADQEQVTTLAGGGAMEPSGSTNHADGSGSAARFYSPKAVAVDAAGNTYVADTQNHLVRKISTSGVVTTLAGKAGVCGSQNGVGDAATFCNPASIAVDKAGTVYVSQGSATENPIRKITAAGEVSTFIGKASLYAGGIPTPWGPIPNYYPVHLAIDSAGTLFAADPNDHVIRKYTANGQATVVSGKPALNNEGDTDGEASAAKFRTFLAIAFDAANRLHVLGPDNSGHPTIRRIGSDGTATTLVRAQSCPIPNGIVAGPPGTLCTANQMVVKANGEFLVAEYGYHGGSYKYTQLRSYTPQGASTVVAGTPSAEGADDGQGSSARFDRPGALAFNPSGALYVRDNGNGAIRTVQTDGLVRTLGKPGGHCTAVTGMASEFLALSGPTSGSLRFNNGPLATDGAGNLYTVNEERVFKMRDCQATLLADLTPLLTAPNYIFMPNNASGIAADSTGNVYVSTLKGTIFKIDTKGETTVFAGKVGTLGHADGQGIAAKFSAPGHMTTDAAGNLYVVDGLSYTATVVGPTIRKITPSGLVSTLAGNPNATPGYADGAGAAALFTVGSILSGETASIAVDNKGNVYVADPVNSVIRKIATDGLVSTPVGQAWRYGFAAGALPGIINRPAGIAVRNSMLYISVPNAVVQVQLP